MILTSIRNGHASGSLAEWAAIFFQANHDAKTFAIVFGFASILARLDNVLILHVGGARDLARFVIVRSAEEAVFFRIGDDTAFAVFVDHAVAVVIERAVTHLVGFGVARNEVSIFGAFPACIHLLSRDSGRGCDVLESALIASHVADVFGSTDAVIVIGEFAGTPARLGIGDAQGFVLDAVSAFGAGAVDATVAIVVFVVAILSGTRIDGGIGIVRILRIGLAECAFVDVFLSLGFEKTVFVIVVAVIDLIFADTTPFCGRIHDTTAATYTVFIFLADKNAFCLDISVFDGATDADGQKSRTNKRCQ